MIVVKGLKRIGAVIAIGCVLWGMKSAYFALTDGFSIANISSDHSDNPELQVAAPTTFEMAEIDKAFDQEFSYLAKGNHSYVFESADKHYVIKFLQFQKYRHHPLISILPLPAVFEEIRLKKALHKEHKRDVLLKSWKTAYTKLKNRTQLLYVHLNRSDSIGKILTVYNKCGIAYRLDLDRYVFLLQRKVDLFPDTIEKLISENNIDDTKKLLVGLIDLYLDEFAQGLFEEDRYIVRNTGVFDRLPMHLDVDRFREDDTLKDPDRQRVQLQWKTALLVQWLNDRYPDLGDYLTKIITEKINKT